MKRSVLVFVIMACLVSINHSLYAQRRPAMRAKAPAERFERRMPFHANGPCLYMQDLSEEQQDQIQALRSKQLEASMQHRNQMSELQARKRTLMTQANPDLKDINIVIDEMEKLRAQHQKETAAHVQEVRSLLTDEQRLQFDARGGRGGYGRGRNMQGCGRFGRW